MGRPKKIKENPIPLEGIMTVPETSSVSTAQVAPSYDTLFKKIDSLHGKDRQVFCKTLTKDEKLAYVKYQREQDMEMVEGIFRCFEPVGGGVKFSVRPYEGTEQTYEMADGQTYTIPKCIAKRMNNEWQGVGTWHPTHTHVLDANGNPTVSTGKKNFRFSFSSLAFS